MELFSYSSDTVEMDHVYHFLSLKWQLQKLTYSNPSLLCMWPCMHKPPLWHNISNCFFCTVFVAKKKWSWSGFPPIFFTVNRSKLGLVLRQTRALKWIARNDQVKIAIFPYINSGTRNNDVIVVRGKSLWSGFIVVDRGNGDCSWLQHEGDS